jgi:alkylation response protein AidB-like acyl-CoA dehydrogenase
MRRALFEPEHEDFRQSFRRFVANEVAPHHGAWERDGIVPRELFRAAGEHGFVAPQVPEAYGGAGVDDFRFNVVVNEELMRAGLTGFGLGLTLHNDICLPYFVHLCDAEQRERWLPGIASGEARGTVGMLRDGEARLVPDADSADVIVLIGFDGSTSVVEAASAEIEPFETMDRTRRFARVRAGAGEPLGGDCFAAGDRIATALAAETVGVAQKAMEMAVEYARDRKQFGRPIGSYQAVSHRCAQMLLEVEGSRSAAYYAGWCADAEPESLPAAASGAKAYSSDAGWRVCGSSLQVHGGIGFTWEHDLHFFLKRAKTNAMLYGSAREHRERVASLALAEPKATVAA